jgi:hypothetical protein
MKIQIFMFLLMALTGCVGTYDDYLPEADNGTKAWSSCGDVQDEISFFKDGFDLSVKEISKNAIRLDLFIEEGHVLYFLKTEIEIIWENNKEKINYQFTNAYNSSRKFDRKNNYFAIPLAPSTEFIGKNESTRNNVRIGSYYEIWISVPQITTDEFQVIIPSIILDNNKTIGFPIIHFYRKKGLHLYKLNC